MLAMSSLIPILVGVVVHLINTCNTSNRKNDYQAGKFYRVDTTASTRPMLDENFEVRVKILGWKYSNNQVIIDYAP